jgi:hypothetical protein
MAEKENNLILKEEFEIKDLVLIDDRNKPPNRPKKLELKFRGPFRITKRLTKTTYEVNIPRGDVRKHNIFNLKLLKRFRRQENDTEDDGQIVD